MAKILIIDDERGIRNTLREILADEGHEVEVAEDGKQGLVMAQNKAYDLIFSDIKMPEMDGIELLENIVESRKRRTHRMPGNHDLRSWRHRDRRSGAQIGSI